MQQNESDRIKELIPDNNLADKLEECFGIKFSPYQKTLINWMAAHPNNILYFPTHTGRRFEISVLRELIKILYNKNQVLE